MLKPTLSEVIDHIRNRTYMGGVERDRLRVKATGEVFTPTELVREMLEQIPNDQFQDPTKTFLDNSCGDGQFLVAIKERTQSINNIYGIELSQDNVVICQDRLGQPGFGNIVCADSLGDTFTNKIFQQIT